MWKVHTSNSDAYILLTGTITVAGQGANAGSIATHKNN